ncbi:DUF459 domain-containing protein [Ciceribacter sp. L1K22]|uniref:SGNH/GDSL hydrolase family protein n=1 Tax=Ciceribacter sp. L1K22 TaxID=2820275 RepID=UPI001FEDE2A7|nr:DUF459 domain-containing protein [Ciceribacter sp. L1K22]
MARRKISGKHPFRAAFTVACLAMFAFVAFASSMAEAQERRRNLLEMLFGPRVIYQPAPPPQPRKQRTKVPRPQKKTTSGSVTNIMAAPPKEAPPAKLEDARKILVVGDFFADALADGLEEAFVTSPGVVVSERSKGSSGLVRDDYYDWAAELPTLLDSEKPEILMVQLGANDRQQIVTPQGSYDFKSPQWSLEYERRIGEIAKLASDRNIPLLWVGLPAFRSSKFTADAITLNSLYRSTVTAAGGEFIDIWEGFVDVEGRFVVTGSDINGQQVRLRGSDGIGMTQAGKRKMAFYVEKSARRLLGDMTSPDLLRLDGSNLPELVSLPPSEIQNVVRTAPIDLSDPNLDGGLELLDRNQLVKSPIPTPRDMLVENGTMPPAPSGRIDDFTVLRTGTTPPAAQP